MRFRSVHVGANAVALALGASVLGSASPATAARKTMPPYATADRWIEQHADTLRAVNRRIWSYPEAGLQEQRAVRELTTLLEREGFQIQRGVAGMPTAFIASAGTGRPILGILAEYDALPGVSQAAEPTRKPRTENPELDAGHACGHSVFGTASVGAAIAVWQGMQNGGPAGTIRLYGTPAEETGIGKVYMARAGLFDDLDAALHWHVSDKTRVMFNTCKAVISVKYRFHGTSAHASLSPADGRSALDAVELMNVGANYLREHLKEDARVHYVITDGGGLPNVVPATAEVWYYLRADMHLDVERMLERLREIADGATKMTRTTVSEKLDTDLFELLPNRTLSEVLQRHLERVGPPQFADDEREFARRTQSDIADAPKEPLFETVMALAEEPWRIASSTDVANVSWRVPTSGIHTACYTHGAPGHSWQIAACTGMSIGEKGMFVAARTLAGAALEIMSDDKLLDAARRDFETRREKSPQPQSVLPPDQPVPTSIR